MERDLNSYYSDIYESFPTKIHVFNIYDDTGHEKDVLCWWCCHKFDELPVYLPVKLLKNGVFEVYGHFCSFECAHSYMKSKDALFPYNKQHELLFKNMVYKMTGCKLPIRQAPSRYLLQSFGGNLSIEEFRKHNFSKIEIVKHPMISIPVYSDTYKFKEIVNKPQKKKIIKKKEVVNIPKTKEKEKENNDEGVKKLNFRKMTV